MTKMMTLGKADPSWVIEDWAGNECYDEAFPSFEAAEYFLACKLGEDYETDRQEYAIVLIEGEE